MSELLRVLLDELAADPVAAKRVCAVCGTNLDGRRADARYCTPSCRREACRIRILLAGIPVEGYRSLSQYVNRRQRRAKRGEDRS